MALHTEFKDIGLIKYREAWSFQDELHAKVSENINENGVNYLLFCEHPHVYTLGKNGDQNNFLINNETLTKIQAEYVHTNRGGDITYHGPGQIVGYPIINLNNAGYGIKEYIFKLEQSIIDCIAEFGLKGERLAGATGVWLDTDKPSARKICAIGVRVSHWVTMHGFAFNVNTNLDYYRYINPCGFIDKGVTSLEKETGMIQDFSLVKSKLVGHLSHNLNLTLID